MTRYRAVIEYDGTNYFGFQRQIKAQQTIQGELEKALFNLAQASIQVIGAGRTDAGVHARGQVIAFDFANWKHGTERLQSALNGTLPRDIAVRDMQVATDEFHPRFDATRRGYRYTVWNRPNPSPLNQRYSWHIRQSLDLNAMNIAAKHLIGEHDFRTFGTPPNGNNSVRRIFHAEWQRNDDFLLFDIIGTAFLKRMVRSIVGSLRLVGIGTWSIDDFVTALQAAERSRAGQSAPACGLVLEFVKYSEQ